jgi:hypothetical protein
MPKIEIDLRGTTLIEIIKSYPEEVLKAIMYNLIVNNSESINKSCETCANYKLEYENPCFEWPQCGLIYDKWKPIEGD